MKRTLSLVLALVMALSCFGVLASAVEFTDQEEIKYDVAVGVMAYLDIINGVQQPDGTYKFLPGDKVSREQAAKMVAYAVLGESVASKLTTTTSSYTDVPAGKWSSPSIEWCVSKKIINGRGDGTFDAEADVTGVELAKMLLCALGYGKLEEYVGAAWSLNTTVDANKYEFFKGLPKSFAYDVPCTREEAAQIIYNALSKNETVLLDKDTEGYVDADAKKDNRPIPVDAPANPPEGSEDIIDTKGVQVESVEYNEDDECYYANDGLFEVAGYELMGHIFDLYTMYSGKDLEVAYAKQLSETIVFDDSTDTKAEWKALGFAGAPAATTEIIENYEPKSKTWSDAAYLDGDILIVTTNSNDYYELQAAQRMKYGPITVVVDTTAKGVTTAKDKDDSDAILYSSDDDADVLRVMGVDFSKLEDDDYYYYGIIVDDTYYLYEYETIQGEISIKKAGSGYDFDLTIDGVKYKYDFEDYGFVSTDVGIKSGDNETNPNLDDTYTFYINPNNAKQIFAIELYKESDTEGYKLAYLAWSTETAGTGLFAGHTYSAQVVLVDGTFGTYTLASINGDEPVNGTAGKGEFKWKHLAEYGYVADSATGKEYNGYYLAKVTGDSVALKTLTSNDYTINTSFKAYTHSNETSAFDKNTLKIDTDKYINKSSAFIYFEDAGKSTFEAKLVNGAHNIPSALKTEDIPAPFAYKTPSSGLKTVAMMVIGGAYTPEAKLDEVYFVTGYNGATKDGHSYTTYLVGEETGKSIEVVDDDSTVGAADVYDFRTIIETVNSDGKTEKEFDTFTDSCYKVEMPVLGPTVEIDDVYYLNVDGQQIAVASDVVFLDLRSTAGKDDIEINDVDDLDVGVTIAYVRDEVDGDPGDIIAIYLYENTSYTLTKGTIETLTNDMAATKAVAAGSTVTVKVTVPANTAAGKVKLTDGTNMLGAEKAFAKSANDTVLTFTFTMPAASITVNTVYTPDPIPVD